MRLYLKVEAVNIYNTILDTDQLSVIRGSSYLLKKAVEDVKKQFEEIAGFKTVSEGGSIGIFSFNPTADLNGIKEIKENAKQVLQQDKYKHFTFVVNAVQAESYIEAKEKLLTQGRSDQVQSLRWPIINTSSPPLVQGACAFNGFLPAEENFKGKKTDKDSKPLRVSKSVNERYKAGLTTRNELYREEVEQLEEDEQLQTVLSQFRSEATAGSAKEELQKILESLGVTYDLKSLAGDHHNMVLDGKIALIYIDGNGFGKAQRDIINKAENSEEQIKNQQLFDKNLRSKRAEYLLSLVALLKNNKAYQLEADPKGQLRQVLQLETLLWGGDEMTIVVPAWIGLKVLKHFYDFFEDFSLYDCLSSDSGERTESTKPRQTVKHAAGLVFCSAKTPIKKVNTLAREIADDIKDLHDGAGREHNLFDYVVLESIDYPTENSMDDFWRKQYQGLAQKRFPLSFQAHVISDAEELRKTLHDLPRTSAYRLIEALIDFPNEELKQNEAFTSSRERGVLNAYENWKYSSGSRSDNDQEKPGNLVPLRYQRLVQSFKKTRTETSEQQLFSELNGLFKEYRGKSELQNLAHTEASFWLHILELYDYLAPEAPNQEDRKEGES